MKRKISKICSLMMVLMMLLTMFPAAAFAEAVQQVTVTVQDTAGETRTLAVWTYDSTNDTYIDNATGAELSIVSDFSDNPLVYTGINKKPDPRCLGVTTKGILLEDLYDYASELSGGLELRGSTEMKLDSNGFYDQFSYDQYWGLTRYCYMDWYNAESYTTDASVFENGVEVPGTLAIDGYHATTGGDAAALAASADSANSLRISVGQQENGNTTIDNTEGKYLADNTAYIKGNTDINEGMLSVKNIDTITFCLTTTFAEAEAEAEYTASLGDPDPSSALIGGTFTVPVYVQGSTPLTSLQLGLTADPANAEITDITMADGLSEPKATISEDKGSAVLSFFGDTDLDVSEPTQVATVTMTVVAGDEASVSLDDSGTAGRSGSTADYPVAADSEAKTAVVSVHTHVYEDNGFCAADNAYDPDASSYIVTTPEQMKSIADGVNSGDTFLEKTITLGADIDLSGYESWTPIGSAAEKQYLTISSQEELDAAIENAPGGLLYDDHGNSYKKGSEKNMTYVDSYKYYAVNGSLFSGTFDGAGYEISNLTVSTDSGYAGLFGHVDGTVQNLTVSGSVTSTVKNGDFVGGIVGKLDEGGTIADVISSVTVYAPNTYNVGGITGFAGTKEAAAAEETLITRCANLGNVTGYSQVGGIAGENAGTISKCYNTGKIDGVKDNSKNGTGGIAGRNGNNNTAVEAGTIEYCYNTGEIGHSSMKWVGGITGFNNALSTVRNCYNVGTVYGTGQYQPLAGQNEGSSANKTGVYDSYYLDTTKTMDEAGYYGGYGEGCGSKTETEMKADDFVLLMNSGAEAPFNKDAADDEGALLNNGYPVLKWQGGTVVNDWDSATWDGGLDFRWYDENNVQTEYHLQTPAQWEALAWICSEHLDLLDDYETNTAGNVTGIIGTVPENQNKFSGVQFYLDNDIDMGGVQAADGSWSGFNYYPIGSQGIQDVGTANWYGSFYGSMNGQGSIVKNVYCDRGSGMSYQSVGLFGRVGAPDDDSRHTDSSYYPEASADMVIENLAVTGYIHGGRSVGGIVGKTLHAYTGFRVIIRNCVNLAQISSTDKKGVGGIVGAAWNKNTGSDGSMIDNCLNAGAISGGTPLGGLVGGHEISLSNSYNIGAAASGISGETAGGTYENLYWLDTASTKAGDASAEAGSKSRTAEDMTAEDFVTELNNGGRAWTAYNEEYALCQEMKAIGFEGYPVPRVFSGETAVELNFIDYTNEKASWEMTGSGAEFTVTCDLACAAALVNDDGTYTVLEAAAADGQENTYVFDAGTGTTVAIALKGDVNLDGEIDTMDVAQVKAASLGKLTLEGLSAVLADVNQDEEISTLDVAQVKAASLGKLAFSWQ